MDLKQYHIDIADPYEQEDFRYQLQRVATDQYPVSEMLKQDTTTTVWTIKYNGRILVVKRYNTKNSWHAFRRVFQRSRANNCRQMTQLFNQAGILTAPYVALIQEWLGPFKGRSWFICEYISGETLHDYFYKRQSVNTNCQQWSGVVDQATNIFSSLQKAHYSHGDFKATNILVSSRGLCLIDLDAAHAHKKSAGFDRAHRKDRSRFMKNWEALPAVYNCFKKTIAPPLLRNNAKGGTPPLAEIYPGGLANIVYI